jgi:VWFA-related protein
MFGKTKWAVWRALYALAFVLLSLSVSLVGQTTWEEKNRAGEKLFQEGKLADANRLFLEALQDAQKFGPNDLRLAPIYNNLALVAFVRSNFATSEALYEKAVAVVESSRGAKDPLLLPILENLTRLYVKEWAFTKGIGTGRRICTIREKTLGPENPDTISSLNQLATLYLDSVRLLPRSDQSPSIATNAKGEGGASATSTSNRKDENATDDEAKLAIAESLYRRVLASQEKTFGARNNRLVDVLQNLGEVLHAEGKSDQAEESYARAVGIIEESFGKEDPKLAGPLQHMADLNAEQDRYPEAAELYGRALHIREKTLGESDPALIPLLTGYAAVMEKMEKPEEAKRLSGRAKALATSGKPEALRAINQTLSVPYVIRFERAVYDRYAGIHQTCMLVGGDGRVRIEDQRREGHGPVNNQIQRSPDGMGDMPAAQETLDMSGANPQPVKIFESTVDNNSLQQLTAILAAKDIRDIQGNYRASGSTNYYGTEKVGVSVLREEGVQNFSFPDLQARQPYEDGLKPLLKWLSNAEKHKGDALRQAIPNNCSPDPPPTVPTQFGPSRQILVAHTSNSSKSDTVSHSVPAEASSSDGAATIKVDVNLVLVRVVVRNALGHAVGNLRREDFHLFDNRKPRPITRFTVEQSASQATEAHGESASDGTKRQSSVTPTTERSLAYFFDDVQLNAGQMAELQSAADRQISSLPPSVQVAIFTTSGQSTLDFTTDHAKLREALSRIKPRKTGGQDGNNCPDIDPYMADLIWNKHDEEALGAATENALVCAYGNDVRFGAAAEALARATAQQRFLAAENDSRTLLLALQAALRKLATAPGQRSLIVVSPGFIAPAGEQDYARLVDGALHSDITISALNARGLYVIDSLGSQTRATVDYQREAASAASELMLAMVDATGGTVFQNNNDFNLGFERVAATPDSSYVLGFSPTEQELDGKFHTLSVAVGGKDEKLAVQARKGYYAIKRGR